MIQDVKDYVAKHKVVTSKLIAKDLSLDEDQVSMILNLLGMKTEPAIQKLCSLGICSPKDKLNCTQTCKSNTE